MRLVKRQRIEGGEMLVLLTSATATSDQTNGTTLRRLWCRRSWQRFAHRSVIHRRLYCYAALRKFEYL